MESLLKMVCWNLAVEMEVASISGTSSGIEMLEVEYERPKVRY